MAFKYPDLNRLTEPTITNPAGPTAPQIRTMLNVMNVKGHVVSSHPGGPIVRWPKGVSDRMFKKAVKVIEAKGFYAQPPGGALMNAFQVVTFRDYVKLPRRNPSGTVFAPIDGKRRPSAKARIMAAIKADPDAADRVVNVLEGTASSAPLTSPDAVADYLRPALAGRGTEAVVVIALDRRRRPINMGVVSIGNDNVTIVDPKTILRWALQQGRSGASAIIMAHNHPSGDPAPSSQDIDVTRRVQDAGRLLAIPLLDHLVITDHGFTSLAQRGILPAYGGDRPSFAF